MKNLKLLAASIVAGSLLASSSQANKIEGTYINLGLGSGEFHRASLFSANDKAMDARSLLYILGVEYIFNYMSIIASLDINFRYIDFGIGSKPTPLDEGQFDMTYLGLGRSQFLGRFNIGYAFTENFALFANVGMTAQGADKSKNLIKEKKMLSNVGFIWGFGARYALNKNWSVRGDLGFNSVSMTKDANEVKRKILNLATTGALTAAPTEDTLGDLRKKKLQYITSSLTFSYNF